MRYRRLQTLGFVALLATLTAIHCIPTEVQADRRRRPWTTYLSASGRLVVECDMTSDTCSDGRKITTTRSTPDPCETSPGVWEMVPEDTGCYSVRGLEAWAANTSYLSYGAELDREPWRASVRGGNLEPLADGWRVHNNPDVGSSGWVQPVDAWGADETRTAACILRSLQGVTVQLGTHGGVPDIVLPASPEWVTIRSTATRPQGNEGFLVIYPGGSTTGAASIDVKACWLTKTSTPGRPCWDGEAPVTCAADRHTISTEGWPTESGEISMVVELNEQLVAGKDAWLFDGRNSGNLMGVNPFIQSNGRLRFRVGGTSYGPESPMLTWEVGRPYALRFLRKGGRTYIYRDGALVYSAATPDWAWAPSAHLGMNFSLSGPGITMNIRSFTVRSYKEGSP